MPAPKEAAIAKAFVNSLANSQLSSSQLKAMAKSVAQISKLGLPLDGSFPQGIVAPDGAVVKGSIPLGQIDLIKKLLGVGGVTGVSVFPKGIVAPDAYRVHVNLK